MVPLGHLRRRVQEADVGVRMVGVGERDSGELEDLFQMQVTNCIPFYLASRDAPCAGGHA